MFGYCDDDRCPLDLWAPEGGALTNRAFSGYAMMMSGLDDIVDEIIEEAQHRYTIGRYEDDIISVDIPSYLTDWEIEYVSQQIKKRLGG